MMGIQVFGNQVLIAAFIIFLFFIAGCFGLGRGHNFLVIFRWLLTTKKIGDARNFGLRDIGPVNALKLTSTGRQKEHVAIAQQALGSVGVDDRARVGFG